MRKRKLLFTMLALALGAFTGGSGAMAQSTNNGWNAILSQTQTTSASWTALSGGSETGKVLGAAQSGSNATYYYYITDNLNFSNGAGGSGLTIHGTVYLYIPNGLSITCEGGNANGQTGAGAGIELSSGNTLYIIGGAGTVTATGGNAANGGNGGNGGNADWDSSNYWSGAGGDGGNGGGGAGAGIGSRGGDGGNGGSGATRTISNWKVAQGTSGGGGSAGATAASMGTLYVANGITVNATGGSAATQGGNGGGAGMCALDDDESYNYCAAGGGGGGGGGFGGAASNIGTGGPGGGGGGGGCSSNLDWASSGYYVVWADGGAPGKNADGSDAQKGTKSELTQSVANNSSLCKSQSHNWGNDDNDISSQPGGTPGSGGGCGNGASAGGTDNTLKNLEYTITYHWLLPSVTTTTVKYNPSTGASVTLPQNSQDGYQWALGVYGKDCHVSGTASEFTTASKEYYGGSMDATTNRTIYLNDVYGDLHFYEVKSVCMLGDSEDNEQEIGDFYVADNNPHANAPKWPITVRLQDRTIYKDNNWNTICLPFSMTKEQIAASPLASATVKKLNTSVSGYYPSGYVNKVGTQQFDYGYPVLLFWFEDVDINGSGTVLEAGKPYLVKWVSGSNLVDNTTAVAQAEQAKKQNPNTVVPTLKHQLDFNYVTVKATVEGSWESEATSNGNVVFAGTFSTTELTDLDEGDNTKLILGPGNKLYYPSTPLSVGACRGYFIIPQAAANLLSTANAPQIVMGFDDGETTSIQVVNGSGLKNQSSDTYYNLNGQRLSAPKKGINIVNGKKIMVK